MADKFQLKAIISAVDKITPTLKGVQRAARMTNKTLRDIGGAGRSLMGSLGLPAGLAFGSVIYGATRAASAALQYAGSIQDAADRTGAGTTEYQTLVAMLEQVGGTAEDAEMAFTQFNKGVSNAAAGADKNFAGLLHKLNIPMKDAQGNVRSLTDMMPELADAFAKNTDPTMRTRMAMELFGKSGTKLIPILAGGRAAYAAWAAEQERMGVIISKDSIGALDDMGDSIGLLNKQVKSQLVQAIASLAPVIQPIIKSMSEWIAANQVLIQTTITKTLTDIVNALKDVDWAAFIGGIRDAIKGIGSFIETMGGMKNVLIALGVIWLAGPLAAIFTLTGSVLRLGWAFGGMGLQAVAATAKLYAFATSSAAIGGGLSATLLKIAAGGALVAAAGAVGYAIGSLIYKGIEGTKLADKIGETVASVLAFFGNEDAKQALEAAAKAAAPVAKAVAPAAKAAAPVAKAVAPAAKAAAPVAKAVAPAAQASIKQASGSRAPSPLIRSGALAMAGGTFQLNGEMNMRFENAPAGFRVSEARTNQPGVAFNPDVGHRSLSLGF